MVVTLRQLRDSSLQSRRLTLQQRLALERAIEERGLVCSARLVDASLDQPLEISRAETGWRKRTHRWVVRPLLGGFRWIAIVVGLLAAVVALYPHLEGKAEPSPMSGDVNLLVAAFAGAGAAIDGSGLAESLFRQLDAPRRSRIPTNPDVQVRGPGQVGVVAGPREATAEARAHGAQIVLYGEIAQRAGRFYAQPRLHVDPHWLRGAEELGGDYTLSRIDLGQATASESYAGRARVRLRTVTHLRALYAFAAGVSWFNAAQWQRARRWFERSRELWQQDRRRALAELFLANTAGKLGQLSFAESAYEDALAIVPGFERARLGLTEIRLQRAAGDCSRPADAGELRTIAASFAGLRAAASGDDFPAVALRLRARLGEARASLCRSLAEGGALDGVAAPAFTEVLEVGRRHGTSFRAELAEARAGLGLSLLRASEEPVDARSLYVRARRQYAEARRLAADPLRRSAFLRMIRALDARLADDGSVWSRADPVPAGAYAQMEYYGIGDSVCGPAEATHPEILTDQRPFYQFELGADTSEPELGETLSICPRGLSAREPVVLTIRGPRGFSRRDVLPPSDDQSRYTTFWVGANWPLGSYEAVARQRRVEEALRFRVTVPRTRGMRAPVFIARTRPYPIPVMAVGQPPNTRIVVDVYREPGDPRNQLAGPARYVTSFPLHTDGNGIGEAQLPTRRSDSGVYLLRVRGMGSYENQDLLAWISICDGGEC